MFDEATSNLDSETEKNLTNELKELLKGKTVIYCAHRLSSIKNVDKIHVLKDGEVKEEGSHATLIANTNSLYKKMWDNYD